MRATSLCLFLLASACTKPVFDPIEHLAPEGALPASQSIPAPTLQPIEQVVATPVVVDAAMVAGYAGDKALMYAFPPFSSAGERVIQLPPMKVDGDVAALLQGMASIASRTTAVQDGSATLSSYLRGRLPLVLLQHGVERFIGPDVLPSIAVEKKAERDGTVVWRGSLAHMALVEPVTLADRVVAGQFLEVSEQKRTYPLKYSLSEADIAAYRAFHPAFDAQLDASVRALTDDKTAYESAFADAKKRYESSGGKYSDKKPTVGDEEVEKHARALKAVNQRLADRQTLRARYPSPDELEADVAKRRLQVESTSWRVRVEARIVDARTQRTLWAGVLSAEDLTAERAFDRILVRLTEVIAG